MSVPITENVYSLAMALLREGFEVEGVDGVREQLHNTVDSICDGIEYGEDDDEGVDE